MTAYTVPLPAQAGPRERREVKLWLPTFNVYTNPPDGDILATLRAFGLDSPMDNRAMAAADRQADDLFLEASRRGSDWFLGKGGGARAAIAILMATRFVLGNYRPVPASNSGAGRPRRSRPVPGQDDLFGGDL